MSAPATGMPVIPPYPLDTEVREFLDASADAKVEPTGLGASFYMDIAERIVRMATAWLNSDGRVVEPVKGSVHAHTSPRYSAAVAPLIAMGRCEDLLDRCALSLDTAISDLAEGRGEAFDFWTRDVALAVRCLEGRVEPSRSARWKRLLGSFDPRRRYTYVLPAKEPGQLHNWAVYSAVGEHAKMSLGARGDQGFVEEQLAAQVPRFTDFGMYRDPNCPVTYDLVSRQNIALLMDNGYSGPQAAFLDEMLRRGGLTGLFFQSASGEMPFGGRSNQFHHVEGMFCCIAEFEARRYARLGMRRLAGAFKRAARLAAASTRRWTLDAEPFRHARNMFPVESLHGCDSYAYPSVYGLLAADLFALAAMGADESIAERPAPCETGGHVLVLGRDFHRVFASCEGMHLEIDFCAQHEHDATGLGRVHVRGLPTELVLSGGITSSPAYRTAETPFREPAAIGTSWREADGWVSLASQSPEEVEVRVIQSAPRRVVFLVASRCPREVSETFTMSGRELLVEAEAGPGPIRLTAPVILTDGEARSRVEAGPARAAISYRGAGYAVEALTPGTTFSLAGVRAPNRNAVYDLGVFERLRGPIAVRFSFR